MSDKCDQNGCNHDAEYCVNVGTAIGHYCYMDALAVVDSDGETHRIKTHHEGDQSKGWDE